MGKFDDYINVTAPLHSATTKGKLGNANEIFLEGDTQNIENEIKEINSKHNELSTKHESLSRTVQGIAATGGASNANNVTYNNVSSGLNAENAQDAIDELQSSKFDKVSILQESGDAEDKVMSQKVVSNKFSDLSKKHNSFVYTNDYIANNVIKELYLYKNDGDINQTLYIAQIVKNVNGYFIVIRNKDGQNVAVLYENNAPSNNEIVTISERNSSGINGEAIVDYSKIDDGTYVMNTAINKIAFSLVANSTIYSSHKSVEAKNYTDSKIGEVKKSDEASNKIVYTNNTSFNKYVKELFLYKKDGTPINKDLYFKSLIRTRELDKASYLIISDIDGVSQCAFVSNANEVPTNDTIITLLEKNSSGIEGKAIVDFESMVDGENYNAKSLLNKKAFSKNFSSTILAKEYAERAETNISNNTERVEALEVSKSQQEDRITKTEDAIFNYKYNAVPVELISNKYLSKDGITEIELSSFYIASFAVNEGDSVKVTGTFFRTGCALCFKDMNNNLIGNVISTDSTINTTITAIAPKGAVKAYTSYRDSGHEVHSQEIGILENRIAILENRMSVELIEDWKDAENVEYTQNTYLKNDGITEVSLDEFVIAKIPVSGVYKVMVNGFYSNILCGLCFKDNKGGIIGEIQHIDGSSTQHTFSSEVPKGAVYAYSSFKTQKSDMHYIKTQSKTLELLEDTVYNNTERIKKLEDYNSNNDLNLDKFTISNVNFIPIFGQSLSVGAAATPIITSERKYKAGIKFNVGIRCSKKEVSAFTSFVPLVEEVSGATVDSAGVGETVASGCVEQLLELLCKEVGLSPYSNYWDNHKFLFGSFGAGSKTILELIEVPTSGIGYYQGVVNAMQAAKNICDENGWTLNIPAWIWIQGETDMKPGIATSKDIYKQKLQQLAAQFDSDAKSITGQSNEVKCICYQTASQNIWGNTPNYTSTIMDVPTAQMELIKDNNMFVASNPVYILDHSKAEHIHLSASGEKMMGLYCGIALKSVIDGTCNKKGVTPATYSISENTVILKCNVPCPPLRVDNTWVKEVDNFGFTLLTSDNVNIIESVKVFDDEIVIQCSQSPLNCRLFYGFNGTSGYDGRLKGSRGNICDCGGRIYNGNIGGRQYTLANYLYTFSSLLSSNFGLL